VSESRLWHVFGNIEGFMCLVGILNFLHFSVWAYSIFTALLGLVVSRDHVCILGTLLAHRDRQVGISAGLLLSIVTLAHHI